MSLPPKRPKLALRIGISGLRNLDPAQMPRLSAQVGAVLFAAKQEMEDLAKQEMTAAAYDPYKHDGKLEPWLRFLSPLARGSDRLGAWEALELGYDMHVPMPFQQHDYELDFDTPDDLDEFHKLFPSDGDKWLALDADRELDSNRAYEAVGRYVVRHCDLLIAIWDGTPAAGRGGTADIVRFAAAIGVPVCWLHATEDRHPAWIADIQDLRDPPKTPERVEDTHAHLGALVRYLRALVRPPAPCPQHRHGFIGWLARLGQSHQVSPEMEYFAEHKHVTPWYWEAYTTFMHWASGRKPAGMAPRKPDEAVAVYWFDHYKPADALASDYASRYRSSYVWIFVLGTFAVIFGALALVCSLLQPDAIFGVLTVIFVLTELVALCLILSLVLFGIRRSWHEHAIEFRLLAELCRKQLALAPLGWTLRLPAFDAAVTDRAAWVAWLFAADQRAAPLPTGMLAKAVQDSTSLDSLIKEQCDYHTNRQNVAEAAGHRLAQWGEYLFAAVLVCVVAKLLVGLPSLAVSFSLFATVLPAVSAAFVGIRAYAELQLLAERSRYMVAELKRARARIERVDKRRNFASQDLGNEAGAVATLMLQDLEGWAQLFRVKGIEPS
jgi:hypothetical protein